MTTRLSNFLGVILFFLLVFFLIFEEEKLFAVKFSEEVNEDVIK